MDVTEKDRIDEDGKKRTSLTDEEYCIIYAVCHVTGMLSACANPIIYGYLNENFNREFKEIFATCFQTPCAVYAEWRKKAVRSAVSAQVGAKASAHAHVGAQEKSARAGNSNGGKKETNGGLEMTVLRNGHEMENGGKLPEEEALLTKNC